MIEFIWWNILLVILWAMFRIVNWVLPKETTFTVLNVGRSIQRTCWFGTVLINDKKFEVEKSGNHWRYRKDNQLLPPEWADILDLHLAPPEYPG